MKSSAVFRISLDTLISAPQLLLTHYQMASLPSLLSLPGSGMFDDGVYVYLIEPSEQTHSIVSLFPLLASNRSVYHANVVSPCCSRHVSFLHTCTTCSLCFSLTFQTEDILTTPKTFLLLKEGADSLETMQLYQLQTSMFFLMHYH